MFGVRVVLLLLGLVLLVGSYPGDDAMLPVWVAGIGSILILLFCATRKD